MKKYKNILIILILTFFFFFSFFLFRTDKNDIVEETPISAEKKEYNYSRLNFFLDKEYRASINIPEYWEGNYRKIERRGKVDFIYLDKGVQSNHIFSIEIVDKSASDKEEVKNLLKETDKYYYKYIISKDVFNNKLYNSMKSDVELILKSFKVS